MAQQLSSSPGSGTAAKLGSARNGATAGGAAASGTAAGGAAASSRICSGWICCGAPLRDSCVAVVCEAASDELLEIMSSMSTSPLWSESRDEKTCQESRAMAHTVHLFAIVSCCCALVALACKMVRR